MNELLTLWNSYPILTSFNTWIMNMSLMNLGILFFIMLNFFSLSLITKVNGVPNKNPKHIITLITITLMFAYPHTLWIAALPYGIVILLLITWQKPIFVYLNLFLPKSHRY